jgi:hypothetical protein
MPTYADVCRRMPTYADTGGDALWAGVVMLVLPLESMAARISAGTHFTCFTSTIAHMLTPEDGLSVCCRMLTYADVC